MWVCWTTHRTKWSNTNVMDTKLKISYHRGHHVLCDIPNNYCTGVNRHDILMLFSQWQPKRGLYPDIRQWRSVCVLFHEWGRVWRLHWWRMDAGHEDQWQTGNTNSFGCVHFWITSSSSRFAWFELLMNQLGKENVTYLRHPNTSFTEQVTKKYSLIYFSTIHCNQHSLRCLRRGM